MSGIERSMENLNTIKYFVISDVHSYYEQLIKALNHRGFEIDNPNHKVIICGDLFDRGPDSVKCFEFVQRLANENRLEYIMGNHEDLLIECLAQIYKGVDIDRHHDSNGTLDTIAQICGCSKYDIYCRVIKPDEIKRRMQPLIDFLSNNCTDFVEIGDFVFVHGWIPVIIKDGLPFYYAKGRDTSYNPNWANADAGEWYQARWLNGMDMWKAGNVPDEKTIVCGHWHCSYGWSHIRQARSEFPPKNRKDWWKSFEPFIDKGIMAIDACTNYSGIVNCLVFEILDNEVRFIVDNATMA